MYPPSPPPKKKLTYSPLKWYLEHASFPFKHVPLFVGKTFLYFLVVWWYFPYTPGSTNIAGWKIRMVQDVFPIENGDIPASYVSVPKGN